jgi:hypothetical protein
VYFAGYTDSNTGTIIATPGSHQSIHGGGTYDTYLVKFDANGIRQWGTYYGGAGFDEAYSCALDPIGNVYVSGRTSTNSGTTIATPGSHQAVFGATVNTTNAFLVKFDVCDLAPNQPLSISAPATVCAGAIGSYSTPLAYGANSYTWSLPSGWLGSSNSNSISATAGASGVFTLTAGNACGVSPQQTLAITVNPLPTLSVNSGSICSGQSFTILASGASSYSYSGGAVVSPTLTSSYTVTGTNTLGCSSTALSTITVNPLPTITVNSGVICVGQSFTLQASGANTYTYSNGPVVSPLVSSSYSVTGTSAAGCLSSNTAVSTVTVSVVFPTITVNSGSICFGKTFTITPSGAATYTIQGGNSFVSPATTANYTVTGTSAAGCLSSNTAIATVSVNPLPIITILSTSTLLCEGETATLTASGASSYTYSPGGAATSLTISPTISTSYLITGTDVNACKNTASFTQSVDACTGLSQLSTHNFQLTIYPNPTNGLIYLESSFENDIIVLNALGQVVYSAKLPAGKHQINLETLAKGLYVLKLGNAKSFKIVKE